MSCESVTRDMPLYLYGELAPEEEERLEAHVHGCEACRRELDCQKRLHRALDEHAVEVEPALLAGCRTDLMRAVRHMDTPKAARPGWKETLFGFWNSLGAMRQPVGALALVALGFFAARFSMRPPSQQSGAAVTPEAYAYTIRSVQPDASGRVQIALDETRRRTMVGGMDDENIRRLLLAAARDEANPGLRVDSIDLLKSHAGSAVVRDALVTALLRDPNAGVRLKALEGLKNFASGPETRQALAQVLLTDENPGVRVQAIDMLMQQRDESLVGVLQNLIQKEDNNYVRLKCQTALQEMNASVGTF
ncbi:MAG: HEAT repeat domain-containing protein [Bryobacterales bacterium]|nr:HEAT repeat domain-containing protein [Bryobacterales bacterium]